ncbi:hypothetical protein [Curtobacterium luteum]|nr:hypothetical protein [Curtobacterium luteum]
MQFAMKSAAFSTALVAMLAVAVPATVARADTVSAEVEIRERLAAIG